MQAGQPDSVDRLFGGWWQLGWLVATSMALTLLAELAWVGLRGFFLRKRSNHPKGQPRSSPSASKWTAYSASRAAPWRSSGSFASGRLLASCRESSSFLQFSFSFQSCGDMESSAQAFCGQLRLPPGSLRTPSRSSTGSGRGGGCASPEGRLLQVHSEAHAQTAASAPPGAPSRPAPVAGPSGRVPDEAQATPDEEDTPQGLGASTKGSGSDMGHAAFGEEGQSPARTRKPHPAALGGLRCCAGMPPLERPGDRSCYRCQRHLARKALEIRLELFSPLVRSSWESACQAGRRSLPKALPPGLRTPQLRSPHPPFVEWATLERIALNITHKALAYQWGLPTVLIKSLAHFPQEMAPPPPFPHSRASKAAAATFTAMETPLVAGEVQERLEWHIRSKRLQHLWGLPGLTQSSLGRLLPTAPKPSPRGTGRGDVSIAQVDCAFLGREVKERLERDVRKRVLFRRWGLPRRVLDSLGGLGPEVGLCSPAGAVPSPQEALPTGPLSREPPHRCFSGATGPRRSGPAQLDPTHVDKLERHLLRKATEMHGDAFPPCVRLLWQHAAPSTRPPLHGPLRPGQGLRRPRNSCLLFVRTEELSRIELSICCSHFSSLWGPSVCHTGGLAIVAPHAPACPPRPLGRAVDWSGGPTPFLPLQAREQLERSILQRRLQHEWGLPTLLQRSLDAVMPGRPQLPARRKARAPVGIAWREPLFLARDARSALEIHVKKMKLQRQWGLPRRVLASVQQMLPWPSSPGSGQRAAQPSSPPGASPCSTPPALLAQNSGTTRGPPLLAALPPPLPLVVRPRHLDSVAHHLAKKRIELQVGTFPAVVRLSRQRAALLQRQPLPRPIPPGHRPPQPRGLLLAFQRAGDMARIELSMRRKRLMSLWGLSASYMETLGGMAPRWPSQPLRPGRGAAHAFSGAKLPFLPEQEQELLEQQVKKKRIQHLWGLPALVHRSLWGSVLRPPSAPLRPHPNVAVHVQREEPSLFPPRTCRHLEAHVQRMRLRQLWGLPSRVLAALNTFAPPGEMGKGWGLQNSPHAPSGGPIPPTEGLAFPAQGQHQAEAGSPPAQEQALPGHKGRRAPAEATARLRGACRERRPAPKEDCVFQKGPTEHVPRSATAVHLPGDASQTTPPKGRRALGPEEASPLRRRQPRGEGRRERGRPSEGRVPCPAADERVALVGSILERKLCMREGYRAWLSEQRRLRKQRGVPGPTAHGPTAPREVAGHAAEVRWGEAQRCLGRRAERAVRFGTDDQAPQTGRTKRSLRSQAGPGRVPGELRGILHGLGCRDRPPGLPGGSGQRAGSAQGRPGEQRAAGLKGGPENKLEGPVRGKEGPSARREAHARRGPALHCSPAAAANLSEGKRRQTKRGERAVPVPAERLPP